MANNYEANGRKNHVDYKCCIYKPLFGDGDMEVLDLIMIPELHIFIGIVNRIVHALNVRWGDNGFYKWCDKNNILYKNYNDNEMNGNSCRDVMKKLDSLETDLEGEFSHLQVYVHALAAFEKVVVACFGDVLLPTFEDDIKFFKDMYHNLQLPMCVKPHILFDHVPIFCRRYGAMGYWSEQAG